MRSGTMQLQHHQGRTLVIVLTATSCVMPSLANTRCLRISRESHWQRSQSTLDHETSQICCCQHNALESARKRRTIFLGILTSFLPKLLRFDASAQVVSTLPLFPYLLIYVNCLRLMKQKELAFPIINQHSNKQIKVWILIVFSFYLNKFPTINSP